MYYFYYENSSYESKIYETYEEAVNAWEDESAIVASLYGYCDPEYLFLAEVKD